MKINIALAVVLLALAPLARAAEWQWSTEMPGIISPETNAHPRAFLWIPPDCKQVRGIVVAQHNMQEEPMLEHPHFRQVMSEIGFAQIWVTPMFDRLFRFDQGRGADFDAMLADLADKSGYYELKTAPIVPIGHSACASFPWIFATWAPERTLAAISVSGTYPSAEETGPAIDLSRLSGVPGLETLGEYEWAYERWAPAAKDRSAYPQMPLSFLGCAADGHFAGLDDKIKYIALYIRKAAEHRLPEGEASPGEPVKLKSIDPTKTGWLADRYRRDEPPQHRAAPVGEYKGDPGEAFWYFDEALAKATDRFNDRERGKKTFLLGYLQDGQIVPQNPKLHGQVPLKFLPDPAGDGMTFKLTGGFEKAVPEGRPEKWTGRKAGEPLDHPTSLELIQIDRICGPVERIDRETWRIQFDRVGTGNPKRSNEIWFVATHPGDSQFKRAVQQAQLRFPMTNTRGQEQSITFPPIQDQLVGCESVALNATSSAGVPVRYYVREGPAIVKGNVLELTELPPRARYPVAVTVVAWQWGRSIEPLLKTATPVEQTFVLTRPGDPPVKAVQARPQQPRGGAAILDLSFNAPNPKLELKNGAAIGEAGSGVSGQPKDLAYRGAGEKPVALIKEQVRVNGLEHLSFAVWYKPQGDQGKDATLFNAGGLTLIRKDNGWVLRVEVQGEEKVQNWFTVSGSDTRSLHAEGEWIFLAGVWDKARNEVVFYQGSKTEPAAVLRRVPRKEQVGGILERTDQARRPDAIGNMLDTRYDRPFKGLIDNFQLIGSPLTDEQVEAIRRADLTRQEIQ